MSFGLEMMVVQLSAKLTVVLLLAWIGHAALAKANPRWQAWLWRTTFIGVFALLIAAISPPLYRLPLFPASIEQTKPATRISTHVESESHPLSVDTIPQSVSTDRLTSTHETRITSSATPETAASSQPATAPVQSRNSRLDWSLISLIVYLLGAALLLFRLALGSYAARRLIVTSIPLPTRANVIARAVAQELGDLRISVRMTDQIESPVLCGLQRPTILLPQSILDSPTSENDVRGAIAHEIAHAAGRDLIWDIWIAIVSACVWPHPLVWRARSAHRSACERISDRVAADCLGDLAVYQGLLARIALRVCGPKSDIGLAMARRSDVRRRLESIAHCPAVPRLTRRAKLVAVCCVIAMIALGAGTVVKRPLHVIAAVTQPKSLEAAEDKAGKQSAAQQSDAKNPSKPSERSNDKPVRSRPALLKFKVVSGESNLPVAKSRITVRFDGFTPAHATELITDSEGSATFQYPDGDKVVEVLTARCERSGFVPASVNFGRHLSSEELPVEKTIRMEEGQTIGGQVVDPEGHPVAEAKLTINNVMYDASTDQDGRWLLDTAPKNLAGLSVRIEHPRFIQNFYPLQNGNDGRYVLDPGATVSGRVVDQNGKPVPGTTITMARGRTSAAPMGQTATTGEDGTYLLFAVGPEQAPLILAQASELTPQFKKIELTGKNAKCDFEMSPGHTTRFKVVNAEGKVIAGVRIVTESWNGIRGLRWDVRTDDAGIATWHGAPAEPVAFSVLKNGYSSLRGFEVTAKDDLNIITLLHPFTVEGDVTDSQGQNIPAFTVKVGRKLPGRSEPYWEPRFTFVGRNGKIQGSCDETCDEIQIRIESKGFRTWTSEGIPYRASPHKISVHLDMSSGPSGVVWSPDGRPAVRAQVMLATPANPLLLFAGYRPSPNTPGKETVVSDEQGHFEFHPQDAAAVIVAVHESGFAEVPADKVSESGGIRLQKWAKVVTTFRQSGVPVAGATVTILPEVQSVHDGIQVVRISDAGLTGVTNSEGQVTFDRVVPRNVLVSKQILRHIQRDSWRTYQERATSVKLVPGETAQVTLGGSGTAVKGRFSMPGKPPVAHRWFENYAMTISPAPDNDDASQHFRCFVDEDGSFRIDDIPPGQYELKIMLTAANDPDCCNSNARLGRIEKRFEIAVDAPLLDLGVIEGNWATWLGPGDKAPSFDVQGIRGEPIRLKDFQGRLLLISFWASWCEPSMAQMPKLAALYKQFSTDARFQMLGLSTDITLHTAEAAVRKNQWPWKFANAYSTTDPTIMAQYNAEARPVNLLVDVDGTILYRGTDFEEIARLIQKRLAQLPAAK